jgi:group II intron reverse transcriptase/maturase
MRESADVTVAKKFLQWEWSEGRNQYESEVEHRKKGNAMRAENSNRDCPQRGSTEYEEYAEVQSIFLPEDLETERELQADNLMEKVVSMSNMNRAIRRVRQNKGAPGIDRQTVDEAAVYLQTHQGELAETLMSGRYSPSPVRRREIPKPDGGVRKLGIPTAMDRVVQQAVAQVLIPIYDPQFADGSYGYRPGRSGQQAILKVKEYAEQGYEWAVVLDLSKYFDTLNHDRLIRELRKTIKDETLMKLIKKFLKAGVMESGVVVETEAGSPQGGPLSPLLSLIYLDEFDHEYEKRGVPEIRYADDIVLLAKSKRAAERLLESSIRFLEGKLKLQVNHDKSRIVSLAFNRGRFKFLGFSMGKTKDGYRIYAHAKSKKKFKDKLKTITSRKRPGTIADICKELNRVTLGWLNYFSIAVMKAWTISIDQWLRRRLRMIIWKRWKKPKTKLRNLMKLGVPRKFAYQAANTRRGYWFTVRTGAVAHAITNERLAMRGYTSIARTYESKHSKPVQLQLTF